jgi:hypothetical protein
LVLELGPTEDYTMRLLASTCLIALISVGSAWAQASNPPPREDPGIGNPAGMSPDKTEAAQGAPASHQPNTAQRIDAQLSGAGEPQAAISEEQHRAGGAGAPGSEIQR